jgi:hypothetical protein
MYSLLTFTFLLTFLKTTPTMPSSRRRHGFGSNQNNRINTNPVQIRYHLAQHNDEDSSGSSGRYKIVEFTPKFYSNHRGPTTIGVETDGVDVKKKE